MNRRLPRLLCRLYPAPLRRQFGAELEDALALRLAEAAAQGRGALAAILADELARLPAMYARAWMARWKGGSMMAQPLEKRYAPTPWRWVPVGLLPFLWGPVFALLGLAIGGLWRAFTGRAPSGEDPAFLNLAGTGGLMLALLVGGLVVHAWRRGFPDWSYPLVLQYVLFFVYLTSVAIPGLVILSLKFGDVLGLAALAPLALVLLAGLLFTRRARSVPPRDSWKGDWSSVSYGLFGMTPLLVRIVFDEVHGEEPFLILLDVLLALVALLFLRSTRAAARTGAILGGLVFVWAVSAVYLGAYWDGRQEPWMQTPVSGWDNFHGTLRFGLFLTVLTFAPWLVGRVRRMVG